MKESKIADCSNELHRMIKSDHEDTFRTIVRLVQDRSHQNLTSWAVYIAAPCRAWQVPRTESLSASTEMKNTQDPLSNEEYETLLIGNFLSYRKVLFIHHFLMHFLQLMTEQSRKERR